MSDPVGLVVLITDGKDFSLASSRLHDDASIVEALAHARQYMADKPQIFRAGSTLVVGEVRVREVSDGSVA
jgi:hypothetical protein